jgi:competence protein ComEA
MLERASVGALALIAVGLSLVALANIPRATPAVAPVLARHLAPPATPTAVQALRDGTRLDLNRAAAGDLELLPGIGPALAQRIVEDRNTHGPFFEIEGLRRVRGIGPRTLERLRPLIQVAETQRSKIHVADKLNAK